MIRKLQASDSKDFYRVRLMALELHPEAFGSGADAFSKATDEQVQKLLTQDIANDFTLGIFPGQEMAGVISLKREYKNSVQHKATIWGFFVHPDLRGQGHGKSLLTALIAEARSLEGLEYLRAVVTLNNSKTPAVFSSAGFSEYGLEKSGIKEGSRYFDQSFMRLDLRAYANR